LTSQRKISRSSATTKGLKALMVGLRVRSSLVLLALSCCFSGAAAAQELEVYVPNFDDGDVSVLNAETLAPLARIPVTSIADPAILVAGNPSAVVFSKDRRLAFVALSNGENVAIIDTRQRKVVQYVPILPVSFDALIFAALDGDRLYVTSCADPYVSVIDPERRIMVDTIPLPGGSYPMAFSPYRRVGYLGNGYEGCGAVPGIHRVDLQSHRLLGFIPTTHHVSDFALSRAGDYGLASGDDRILIISLITKTQVGFVRCGSTPCTYGYTGGIVFNGAGTRAYSVDWDTGDFITINTDRFSRGFLQELSRVKMNFPPSNAWQLAVRGDRAFVVTYDLPSHLITMDISRDIPIQLRSVPVGRSAYELGIVAPLGIGESCDDDWRTFWFFGDHDDHHHDWRRRGRGRH
jgi:DNA-binding beta-propeller fold protein YncE